MVFWINIVRGTDPGRLPGVEEIIQGVVENGAFDAFAWVMILAGSTRTTMAPASLPMVWVSFLTGFIVVAPVRRSPSAFPGCSS